MNKSIKESWDDINTKHIVIKIDGKVFCIKGIDGSCKFKTGGKELNMDQFDIGIMIESFFDCLSNIQQKNILSYLGDKK